jgi:hypothetical protein
MTSTTTTKSFFSPAEDNRAYAEGEAAYLAWAEQGLTTDISEESPQWQAAFARGWADARSDRNTRVPAGPR